MSTHLTHFNGREIATVLQTQARLCVWYVEQDAEGRLCRRPFWGRAFDYDPSSGLKVWLDGAQSEDDCEWVDEGDDWEWETPEQAAERHGAVQLKLNINDHPLCVRLPFKRPATGAPPTTNASESAPEPDGERSRPESPYTFAKKAKLLRAAAAQEAAQQQLQASHAAALQAYSAGVGAREHTERLAQQAAHHHLDRHLDHEMAASAAAPPPPPLCARPGSSTGSRSSSSGSGNASPRHRPAAAPPTSPRAAVCGAPAAAPAPFPHAMRMATGAGGYLPYPVSQYPGTGRPPSAAPNGGAPATAAAKRAARGGSAGPSPRAPQSGASSRPLANWNQIIIL